MNTKQLPPRNVMVRAFLDGNTAYEGVFVTAVQTTGIFCRPACPARKPRPENVAFYATAREALEAGFRPCKRCRPLEPLGTRPDWLRKVLHAVEEDPTRRWRDQDLRDLGAHPVRVRRWFQESHGMTFHAYSRALRLGHALGRIQLGESITAAAFDTGYDSLSGFNEAFRHLLGDNPTRVRNAPLVQVTRIPTELGPMVAAVLGHKLVLLEFIDRRMLPRQIQILQRRLRCRYLPGEGPGHEEVARQLDAYFRGERAQLGLDFDAPGTEFQQRVWQELRKIPPGCTVSYAELARRIGEPSAVRAVARANGDNRLAILIPCHRVVGSDGSLTGYGGGLWRKKRLLEIEARAMQATGIEPRVAQEVGAAKDRSTRDHTSARTGKRLERTSSASS